MSDASAAWQGALTLFDEGRYLASHELFEELWEASEGGDADFFKGLIQAAIALHHFQEGNLAGAAKLYAGHRRYLARFLPKHRGIDVSRFLIDMQSAFRPLLRRQDEDAVAFEPEARPRFTRVG